jgi:hypothetical protein
MDRIGLEVVWTLGTVDKQAWFSTSCDLLERAKLLEAKYKFDNARLLGLDAIEKRAKGASEFTLVGLMVEWGVAFTSYHLQRSYFEPTVGNEITDPRSWVEALVSTGEFVSARLYDIEFEHWQNQTQPSAYESAGLRIPPTSITSDPVFGRRVDISKNPGRTIGRNGYREGLGHQMWLSSRFFAASGVVAESVCRVVKCSRDHGTFVHLTLSDSPFNERNLPSEELRRTIFTSQ